MCTDRFQGWQANAKMAGAPNRGIIGGILLVSVVVGGMVLHFLFNCNTLEQMSLPWAGWWFYHHDALWQIFGILLDMVRQTLERSKQRQQWVFWSSPEVYRWNSFIRPCTTAGEGVPCTSVHPPCTAALGLQRVTLVPQTHTLHL